MDQNNKEKIINALREKGVKLPCPRCNSREFEVVGQTILPLNENIKIITIGGAILPSAIIACSNCGFLTLHALSSLNLLQKKNNNE